jgi:predicted RND superfamily exporter protein
VVIGFLQTARNLTVNNALTIWFLDNNPQYREYLEFQKEQGSDQIVVAMIPIDSALSSAHFARLQRLHLKMDSLDYINSTLSLANLQYPLYANERLYFRNFYTADRSLEWMQKTLADLPALRDQLISEDGNFTFFYLQLDPNDIIEANRRVYVRQTVEIIRKTIGEVHITGPPIINEAFSLTIYQESTFFAIMTVIVIISLLLFLLPHWNYLPIAFASVIVTVSITLGLMSSLGYSLNLISMLIPTILMVYAVSDSIHIINIFHVHRKEQPEQSRLKQIQDSLQKSLKPCFYTTLTTVIGYLALSLSPLPAFRVTGVFTFLGISIAFFTAYIVTAIGFYYISDRSIKGKIKKINISAIVRQFNFWTSKKNTAVLILGGLIFLAGIMSLSRLEVSTDSLNLLGKGKVKSDLQLIEKKLQGSSRLQLNIIHRDSQSLLNKSTLKKVGQYQDSLLQNPLLAHPVSIINFKSFLEDRMPAFSRFGSIDFEEVVANSDIESGTFFSFASERGDRLAININIKELETKNLERLMSRLRDDFKSVFNSEQFELKIHGFTAVYAQLNQFILQTQFRSFGAAFVVAFCILFYFIGDLRTSFLALLPNLIPLSMAA